MADDFEEGPTPIEIVPPIERNPSKRVVTRAEADRMLAALERRRHLLSRAWFFFRTFLRRLFR